nr:NAD-dependent epimerase/dehydratase family protein [Salsipaludibacter albus]
MADPAPTVVDDGDAPDVEDADDELVEEDRDAHEPEGDIAHLDDGGDLDDVADGGDAGTVDGDASQVVSTATSPGEDDLDVAPGEAPAPTRGSPGPVVVVTGGSGHIGSLVVDALVRDARVGQVVAVDRRAPSVPRPRVVEVTADLDAVDLPDLFASHEVAVVVHLAAILDPPSDMDDDVLHDLEVGGTQRVVDAAVAAGVTHLTVASSGAAYGYHQSNRGRRLTEDDPLRGHPDHAYARHKAEVEQLLATARRLHPELGQLVLRLSTVLGPATANPVTRLFRAPVVLTLRDSPVPFSFVWDADVASVVTTGVVERRTGIYNVAGDGVVTMREVAELSGKRAVAVPSGWVERGLGLLARRDLAPFGPEQVDFLRHRPVLANDRLHRDFPGALTKSSREAFLAWVAQDR